MSIDKKQALFKLIIATHEKKFPAIVKSEIICKRSIKNKIIVMEKLASELLLNIFEFLEGCDLVKGAEVCQR